MKKMITSTILTLHISHKFVCVIGKTNPLGNDDFCKSNCLQILYKIASEHFWESLRKIPR